MKAIKSFIKNLIPSYAYLPLILVVSFNFISFSMTQLLMGEAGRHTLFTSLDHAIPFVPGFIYIYVLAFVQWGVNWIPIAREGKEFCYYYAMADIVAKIVCFLFFVFYPTIMIRPEFEVTGFTTFLVDLIYKIDKPYNLFPSIHVLGSYLATRVSFRLSKAPRYYRLANVVLTCLVCLSILFVKQHVVLDIPGGILACEIGLTIAYLCRNRVRRTIRRISHEE